jgi:SAM-dependent methyltransferase
MSTPRVALIFDDTARPETTGVYCRRALEGLAAVQHVRPTDLEQFSRSDFDFYLNIDDGLRYLLPADLHPSAWWAIDTHMDFDWCLTKSHDFDLVFAAQRDGAERLCDEGITTAWLPLACDPEVHRKHEVEKAFDVCFVGNVFPGERADLLRLLQGHFPNTFVGQRYFEEMARTYSVSRVVFNRSVRNDVNMRVFEAVACGSLLVTNDLRENGQEELFRDGLHLATYREPDELLDKVRFYLAREAVRERIAAAGRAEALARHTYRQRMEVILAEFGQRAIVVPVALAGAGADRGSPRNDIRRSDEDSTPATPQPQDRPSEQASGTTVHRSRRQGPLVPVALAEAGADRGSPGNDVHRSDKDSAPATPQPEDCPSEQASGTATPVPTISPTEGVTTNGGIDPYFEFARPELLALIPESARKVLDIGCGAGRLGEALKARQAVEVVGIEYNETAAEAARIRLDTVLTGDVEKMELPFAPGSFDAIVCGDLLEHLRFPERLLTQARGWLQPGGQLIASIPNVRHHTVIRSLLDGNWTYEGAGLLDQTHLCFFTRRDIDDLFRAVGFRISDWRATPGPGDEEWWRQGARDEVHAGRLHIAGLPPGETEEFYVYQYLITAQSVADGLPPASAAPVPVPAATISEQPLPERPATRKVRVAGARRSRSRGKLRIMLLGDFGSSWRHETQTANALVEQGHAVSRFHEYLMPSVDHVVGELNSGRYDCLLFYKGRIAARTQEEVFCPTGEPIAQVIEQAKPPCYTWYVDRAYQFDLQPSREVWMRRVAPLCRLAFVADAALACTSWGRWRILREPIDHRCVQRLHVAEAQRKPLAFIGQLYGSRAEELAPLAAEFPIEVITGTYGAALSPAVQGYRIILGPRYPTVPGFWGNRVYVVLGHGGFFLAPEVEGMREEGILPGVHYAPLGPDARPDVRRWLACPDERARIARAGQELVLERFTYRRAVRQLCQAIEETL